MLAATFVFLGLSVLSVMSLLCPDSDDSRRGSRDRHPAWGKKASWREIKTAYEDRYASADGIRGNPKRNAASSWSRTFALCASLCLVGVLLEAEYDKRISIAQIVDDLTRPYLASFSPKNPPISRR